MKRDSILIYISIAICILFLLITLGVTKSKLLKEKSEKRILENKYLDSINYYKNKEGLLIAQKKTIELTTKDLKRNLELLDIDRKELKKQIGSLTNLVSLLKLGVESTDTITIIDTVKIINRDTFNFQAIGSYVWSNQNLKLKSNYSLNDTIFNQVITYSYMSKINATYYYREERFWKPKYLVVDVSLDDPNAIITDITSLRIKQSKKRIYQRPIFWFGVGAVGSFFIIK